MSTMSAAIEAERQRQELLGNRVPSAAKEPALYAIWLGEAERRVSRTATSDGKLDPPPPPSVSPALLDMNMTELQRQSSNGSTSDLLSIALRTASASSAETEVRELLRLLEFLVALHFRQPNDLVVVSTILSLRSDIANLHRTGILGNSSSQQSDSLATSTVLPYDHVNALYELFCFRRLISRWHRMPNDETRRTAITTALAVLQRVDSVAHRKLIAHLETLLISQEVERLEAALLQRLVEDAAKENPLQFPTQTLLALEQALGAPIVKPSGKVVSSQQQVQPTARMAQSSESMRRKRQRSDSPDDELTMGDVLREHHPATTASKPQAGLFRVDEARPRTSLPTTKDPFLLARRVNAAHPVAPQRAAAASTAATAGTLRYAYPCKSKYHATYSVAEKHASQQCCYCAVCHLMEILFNGCGGGCVWKHDPTPKKLALHLKRFPAVYRLALQRYDALLAGELLEPLDLPR